MSNTHLRVAAVFWRLIVGLAVLAAAVVAPRPVWAAKNVILMIADGGGHNQWLAASMYQGKVGKQVYDQAGWIRLSCSTCPLNCSHKPTGDAAVTPGLVYDPQKAWDAAPRSSAPGDFAGYVYLTRACTDSAAAGTALASGQKTYDNAINWTNDGKPMLGQTIAEIAKAAGKSAGVVTTVPWSDATPATLGGAHNVNRRNRAAVANEMLGAARLDVIMGAGNPDFDNDGQALPGDAKRDYNWVGGRETWEALKAGKRPWKLIEKKADFEALTAGPTPPRVLATAQAASTLQEKRSRGRIAPAAGKPSAGAAVELPPQQQPPQPFADPPNRNVPSLAVMAQAAINCLDDNPKGFYLMIEGGAVDWANHANQPDRMVEEQIDFVRAVETVAAWIESHGGWNDTLLILTADHESGLLWGADSGTVAFEPLLDRGTGKLPGMKYNSHGHSSSLVPLWARGAGSRRFAAMVKANDPTAAAKWRCSGQYVDNTDIFTVMRAEVTGRP